MNGFNPGEASYVSPHMMSFVGLESSSSSSNNSQKQQLWDWETTSQAPNTTALQASLFANSVNNPFYGCGAAPSLPALGAAGAGGGYPFHPMVGADYPAVLVKSEDDRGTGLIGLNLGHRTYFPSGDPAAGAVDLLLFRRSRGIYPVSQQVPRCQAEGCKADLSGAKHYHRRHKVCELHSKASVVVAGGMQQRFCQQCSRFHLLSEFDEAKRSCRRRLAEHNRRRRKSQPPPPTAAGDSSTPPDTSTTSTEKSKQSSAKSVKNTEARDTINTAVTSVSTISTPGQGNISSEEPRGCQTRATHMRNGPSLSLGGAEGADRAGFGFHSHQYHQRMPWAVMSDKNNSSQQQQQRISSSSSSSSIFFQSQNYFCSSANGASQSTAAGGHQDTPLQLGQGMLEVDFI